jgi:hypothetical protein
MNARTRHEPMTPGIDLWKGYLSGLMNARTRHEPMSPGIGLWKGPRGAVFPHQGH